MSGELITGDYQIQWRDLVLGDGTPYGWVDLEGWRDRPDVRVSNSDRPGRHGQFLGQLRASGRTVTLTYDVAAAAADFPVLIEALEEATTWDENPVEEDLVVQLHGVRQVVRARCHKATIPTAQAYSMGYTQGAIQWVATDPRRYGAVLRTLSTNLPAAPNSGLAFPLAFPLAFGPPPTGGTMVIDNAGGAACWPVWVINGPVTGPIITNLDTGEVLAFDPSFTLDAGQQVVIDTDTRLVLLAGTTSRRDQLNVAQWFPIPKRGTVRVGFSAAAPSTDARLDAQWRDAWM